MKIGIVGGGLMGLRLAERLVVQGHKVTVYERDRQLGGLATHYDFGSFTWDKFYHVILPTDTHLLQMTRDIGLEDALRWRQTLTGFYVDDRLYSLSSNIEFLRFPVLSLWSKFRLALTILYCARIDDWKRLEKIPVDDWLKTYSGHMTYEKFWRPLLLAKLGDSFRRVSAVFIWSYIKRLYSARDKTASREQLGHVQGGYKTVFDRLREIIESGGGEVRQEVSVERIDRTSEGGIQIASSDGSETFDKVVCTSPVSVLRSIVSDDLIETHEGNGDVEYLGVVCMVLITRRPLTPYYVINIADPVIPFTGVIGMSNVVSTDETAGLHITYFPKYVPSDDPYLRTPDEEIRKVFLDGVHKMFPEFRDEDVESVHINRAFKVQPIQVLNYSDIIPTARTRHPNFFVLNTSQFVNGTLNNNMVVHAIDEFLANTRADFRDQTHTPPAVQNKKIPETVA